MISRHSSIPRGIVPSLPLPPSSLTSLTCSKPFFQLATPTLRSSAPPRRYTKHTLVFDRLSEARVGWLSRGAETATSEARCEEGSEERE